MATPAFVTGWEHQSLATAGAGVVDAVSGGVSIETGAGVPRSGAACLKVISNGATAPTWRKSLATTATRQVGRFYIKVNAVPGATAEVMSAQNTGATWMAALDVVPNGSTFGFQWRVNTGSTVASALNTYATGTWIRIDYVFANGASPWTTSWQIDGVDQTGTSNAIGGNTCSQTRFGSITAAHNITFWIDDFTASVQATGDYPLGDGTVVALLPAGVGTHSLGASTFRRGSNDTTPSFVTITAGETASWADIDEWPPVTGTSADWVDSSAGTAGTAYIEHTLTQNAVPADAQSITGAYGIAAIRNDSGATANVWVVRIRDGANDRNICSGTVGIATLTYKGAGMVISSAAPLNGLLLRQGFSTDIAPVPRTYAVILEVDYVPAVVATALPEVIMVAPRAR